MVNCRDVACNVSTFFGGDAVRSKRLSVCTAADKFELKKINSNCLYYSIIITFFALPKKKEKRVKK